MKTVMDTRQPNCQHVIQSGASDTRFKEESEKSSFLEDAEINMWDSLESDTESLAQERRYQMELKSRITQANKINANGKGDAAEQDESSEEEGDDGEDDLKEPEEEDDYIYDSLDVTASQQGRINTGPYDTEVGEILQEKRQDMFGCGPVEDKYAALRYDPNWRTNLKGDQPFEEGNQPSIEEEGSIVYADSGLEMAWKVNNPSENRDQKNSCTRRPTHVVGFAGDITPESPSKPKSKLPPTPYYQPPQSNMAAGAKMAGAKRHGPRKAPQGPEDASSNRGRGNGMPSREKQVIPHDQEESYEEMNQRYAKEYQRFYEQESARTKESENSDRDGVYNKLNQPRRLSNARQTKPKEDIVERNRRTLGVRSKQASYLFAHGQKAAKEEHKQQESEAVEEIMQPEYLDPEQRWHQKTQRLKVHREKKKGKREGTHQYPGPPITQAPAGDQREGENPSGPQDRRAAGALVRRQQPGQAEVLVVHKADPSDASLSAGLPALPWPPDRPPYMMNPPTLNLHINLSASRDMAPFLGQEPERTSLKLSPHHGPPPRSRPAVSHHAPASDRYDPAHYDGPRYLPTAPLADLPANWYPAQQVQGTPPKFLKQGGRRRPREVPPLWDPDSHSLPGTDSECDWISHTSWQSAGEWNMYLSPGDQHIELLPQHRLPAQSPGSYTVLPPIGETVASDSELSSQNTRQKINSMQRCSSEGYLAQLEKQKQLKEKANYKAYTLKDYKALKQDVKLGGLGPDYKVTPITAEKIRRRQQYSNKVREHNKHISRVPFLPTRNPFPGGGDTAENTVPRKKALEYARSIPKPKPPAEPKNSERDGPRDLLHERAPYLEHLDLSQLARLDMLQKRHEEEKQVVAHFKALRAV